MAPATHVVGTCSNKECSRTTRTGGTCPHVSVSKLPASENKGAGIHARKGHELRYERYLASLDGDDDEGFYSDEGEGCPPPLHDTQQGGSGGRRVPAPFARHSQQGGSGGRGRILIAGWVYVGYRAGQR